VLVTSPRIHGGCHGVEPSPGRTGPTWSQFVGAHAPTMPAGDFLHVDTVLLRRLYVLFSIGRDTRRVHVSGITANSVSGWVTQPARNLSFALGGKGHPSGSTGPSAGSASTDCWCSIASSSALGEKPLRIGYPAPTGAKSGVA
jgi:hypothetical protein